MKGRWQSFLGKRTVALLLSILLLGTSVPIGAFVSLAAQPTLLGTVSAISGAESEADVNISNPSGNQVVVTYENPVELVWAPAEPSIGRYQDGWWAGIRVDAPKNDNIDLKKATYQGKAGGKDWSNDIKSFWDKKDSDNEAETHFITLWMPIKDVNTLKTATSDLIYTWRFDWNNDGKYEQSVQMSINPTKVILKDADGKQVYPLLNVSFDSENVNHIYTSQRVMTITVPSEEFVGIDITASIATNFQGDLGAGWCEILNGNGEAFDLSALSDTVTLNTGNTTQFSVSYKGIAKVLSSDEKLWTHNKAKEEWTARVRFAQEDIYQGFTLSVPGKPELGAVDVPQFTYDTTAPEQNTVGLTYNDPIGGWKGTETAPIGYYKDTVTVNVSAKDSLSGIQKFVITPIASDGVSDNSANLKEVEIQNGDPDFTGNQDGSATASVTFKVPENTTYQGRFSCKAVNAAGKECTAITDNHTIVVDNTAPEVAVTFDPATSEFEKDGTAVYNQARTMTIAVKDPNFYPSAKSADATESISLKVDVRNMLNGAPGNFEFVKNGVVQATVNKDSLKSELQKSENWMYDAGTQTWSVQIRVVGDAIYSNFKVTATDLSGNKNTADATEFIYDTHAPNAPQVTYTESVGATILNAISFGGAKKADFIVNKESVQVSLTTRDGMSGVEKFIVTVNEDGIPAATSVTLPEDTDKEKPGIQFEIDKNSAKELAAFKDVSFTQGEGEKADTFTATFTIPAQFRKALSYEAMDYAGNTSTADGKTIVVDTLAPNLTITYAGADEQSPVTFFAKDRTETEAVDAESTKNAYIANGKVQATLTFTDANLDLIAPSEKAIIEISKDGGAFSVLDSKSKAIEWSALEEIDQHVLQQTATVKLEEDGTYQIRVTYTDAAGNEESVTSGQITVDTTAPEVTVTFDPATSDFKKGDTEVYNTARTMTIAVTDRNFQVDDMQLESLIAFDLLGEHNGWGRCDVVRADGTMREGIAPDALKNVIKNSEFWQASKENSDTKTFTVRFNELEYSEFEVIATDLAGNVTETKQAGFIVDKTAPDRLSVQYSAAESLGNVIKNACTFGIYKTPVTVTLGAEDRVAGIEKFIVTANPNGASASTNVELPADIDPKADGIQFEIDASSKDDKETFGSFKGISLKQNEENAKEFTASFTVPAQYRGGFTFTAVDYAGNETSFESAIGTKGNPYTVIDTVSPTLSIAYAGLDEQSPVTFFAKDRTETEAVDAASTQKDYIVNGKVQATLTFTDANLDLIAPNEKAIVEISKDGGEFSALNSKAIEWYALEEIDHVFQQTATVKLEEDGDYKIRVTYTDAAGNEKSVTSGQITVDTTAPEVTVTFDPATSDFKKGATEVYNTARKMTITVTDRNFRVVDMKLEDLTASDLLNKKHNESALCDVVRADGTTRAGFAPAALQNVIKNPEFWQTSEKDADTYTFTVTFHEMIYSDFKVTATDYADNSSEPQSVTGFIVDKTAPENVKIEYSANIFQTTLSGITFGTYNPSVQVTLTTKDTTSGVEMFEITVEPNGVQAATTAQLPKDIDDNNDNGVQFEIYANSKDDKTIFGSFKDISFDQSKENAGKFTATFSVPAQYRGQFSAVAVDYAENTSEAAANKSYTAVVDSVAPQLAIHYTQDPQNKVNGEGKLFKPNEQVNADSRFIFNSAVKVELTFTDANLDLKKPDVKVVSADTMEQVSADAANVQWSSIEKNGDVLQQTATVTLAKDGDYRICTQYSDAAGNQQKLKTDDSAFAYKNGDSDVYTTNILTVDTVAPILYCVFPNESEAKNIFDGRAYYQTGQTVDLEITEHNFEMMVNNGGLQVDIQAKNSQGDELTEIKNDLTKMLEFKKWTKVLGEEDTYSVRLEFQKDANYTFSIAPQDLANNAAENNPQASEFTVDKVAPGVAIRYAQKVADTVIDAITFGYYNAQVEATVTATDDTSGVYRFEYEGLLAEGVSEKNQAVLKSAIGKAQIRQEQNRFIAKFNIPRETLNELNSFNGTVTVSAYDKSENISTLADTERLVVDKIPPTCNVTFTPEVQTVNNISYYDGPLTATIQINEANFYAEDVVIRVNGTRVEPTDWIQNGDVWTSTVTLTEEGDYKLTVEYTDRSGNTMFPAYESNQKTIDTTLPILRATKQTGSNTDDRTGLYESANNAETIGFTLTVTDRNIGAENIVPKLISVQREGEAGNYTFAAKEINIDAPTSSVQDANGNWTYTYTVENLPQDGYYTLTCDVKDYANHTVNTMEVSSSNGLRTVESVPFSVNREGSVFFLEAKHNGATNGNVWKELVNDAYVNQEVEVVLHEVNVDRVNTIADKQTVLTLNDGSKAEDVILTEGQNYEKNTARGAGGWFESIYTLRNDNFNHDGYYSLNILTYDMAGNTNINQNGAQGTIRFTVDRTAPVVTFNASSKQPIKADSFPLEIKLTEMNLDVDTVLVTVRNSKGEESKLTSAELNPNGGDIYRTDLQAGTYDSVTVYAKDLAGNESTTVIEDLTISTNNLVLFYAGHPVLCWLIVVFVLILTGFVLFMVLFKRRKKEQDA